MTLASDPVFRRSGPKYWRSGWRLQQLGWRLQQLQCNTIKHLKYNTDFNYSAGMTVIIAKNAILLVSSAVVRRAFLLSTVSV